jgi:hypothetical protein
MQRYKITMVLELDEEASHPRKWLAETIYDALRDGEDLVEIQYEELVDSPAV